jgi:hypothetical protein
MFMPPEAIEKSEWGPGSWQEEPDELDWVDEATGYKCLIKRHWTGCLNGYVGLSEGHPMYGKRYGDRIPLDDAPSLPLNADSLGGIPLLLELMHDELHGADGLAAIDVVFQVHGSVTFTDFWEDQDNGLWYFGFDTGHCDDYQPGLIASTEKALGYTSPLRQYGTYRDLAYVQAECRSLAKQLKELEHGD